MSTADLESSSCLTDTYDMPWAWILEYLLDVKEISPLFLKDIIGYVRHIEQPQSSRLVQKLALRYLEEVTSTHELDTSDVILIKFLLKEQGVSDVRSRIHSLKESFTNDLTLRVATEAVLKNLRSSGKEGRREDWTAFKDALDNVFSKDTLDPREAERRNELAAALTDLSNGESSEDLREKLLGRYPLEDLRRDLARFLDDEKKLFKIKFLDQLAKDVENEVYCPSPSCNSPETRSPSGMYNDFCYKNQFQESLWTGNERSVRKATHHPSSDRPSISSPLKEGDLAGRADDEDHDHDRHHEVSGVNVSEAKDVRAELSFGIAEVDKIANGFANDGYELVNHIATFTEDISQPKFARTVPTSSPVSPEKVAKRSAAEIFDQVTDVAKRRKIDEEVVSEAKRDQSIATDENVGIQLRSIVEEHLGEGPNKARVSSENDESNSMARVHENRDPIDTREEKSGLENCPFRFTSGELNPPVAGGEDGVQHAKCCFCGNSGGCQALCDRCPSSIHESCLSKLSIRQEKIENCWYCFACADSMAKERLREAEDAVKKYRVEALATQANLETFLGAQRELFREQPKEPNTLVELNKATFRGKVTATTSDTIQSLHPEQGPSEDFLPDAQGDDRSMLADHGTIKATNGPVSCSTLRNVATEDTITDIFERQETKMQTDRQFSVLHEEIGTARGSDAHGANLAREVNDEEWLTSPPSFRQSSVIREGTCAARGNDVPRPELGGEVDDEEGPSSEALPLPATLTPAPRDKHQFECCGDEQSGDPGSSSGRVGPESTSAENHLHIKSSRHDGVSEDVRARDEHQFECCGDEQSGDPGSSNGRVGPESTSAENNVHIETSRHDGVSEDVRARDGSEVSMSHLRDAGPPIDPPYTPKIPEGEEADRHASDLEEVCEGNPAAAETTNVAEKAAELLSEKISPAKRRRRKVDRARGQIPGVRRQILPWTRIEEDVLKEGVSMFSNKGECGFKWSRIREFGAGKFHETRTGGDLKDKWRNMRKGRSTLPNQSS